MKIQSQGLPAQQHLSKIQPYSKPQTGLPVLLQPILANDSVRFGAKKGNDLAEREAENMLRGNKKPELLVPDFFRGAVPLTALSKVDTHLTPQQELEIQAYTNILKVALRPKHMDPKEESKLLDTIYRPSEKLKPYINGWQHSLHLTPERLSAVVDAHQIDQNNDIPPEVHQRMSDLGLYRLKIPKEYGGMGLHQKEYARVLETFPDISSSLGTVVSAHSTIGSAPLLMYGTEGQKNKFLRNIAKGEALAAFCLTEPNAGTDLRKLQTTATLSEDGKHWILNGEKIFITNTPDSSLMYVVAGKTNIPGDKADKDRDQGIVLIVELPFKLNESQQAKKKHFKDLAKQGMFITPFTGDALEMMMIRGTDQAYIHFKDFKVPVADENGVSNVLGQPYKGKDVPLHSLNAGRAGFGPYVTAAAGWFATAAIHNAIDRQMFDMYSKGGPGVQANMESVRAKIGDMKVRYEAIKAASDLVSALIDENPGKSNAGLSAAIKVRATDEGWKTAQIAAELYGGHGLIKGAPNAVERNFRDAWIPMIVEGVNPAMAQLAMLMGAKPLQREIVKEKKILPFIKSQLNYFERGDIPLREAFFIQRMNKKLSRRMIYLGGRLGDGRMAKRQNTLIRGFNVFMDLFTLSAVQIKLHKKGEKLPESTKLALETATQELKTRIKQEVKYLSMKGHPLERKRVEVGDAFIAAAKNDVGRKNTQDEHMAFLHERAQLFHQQLEADPTL